MKQTDGESAYEQAARGAVELGNRVAEDDEADLWDIADGLLAGTIHYWLYSRQPCGDPQCEDCQTSATAEDRMATLLQLVEQLARDSEYYHSPNDTNVGRA